VLRDRDEMDLMLKYSGGERTVPVIVEGAKVTIGFDGGS
jgi:hypothetical protein